MLQPLLNLYTLLEDNSSKFTTKDLAPISFIDVYRSQPLQPELYEYFELPAIFVDYTITGNGKNQPRSITMTLHILVDDMPDTSNISEQKNEGFNRFLYLLLIQEILEGSKLGKTTQLKFLNESSIDLPVANYHTQSYQFDAYLADMIADAIQVKGQFERLNIYKSIVKNS